MAQKSTHLNPRGAGDAQPAFRAEPVPTGDDSLDPTLPPMPLKKLLAADGAAVYVLTDDAALVDVVIAAGGDQFPIQTIPTFRLRSLVEMRQCKIALLDAEPFGGALRARIAELKAIEPELVMLVAAPRATAEALMGLFSERIIHRLLIKPPAIGITRLLLESAVSRYLQIRGVNEVTLDEPIVAPRRQHAARAPSSRSAWFLAIALVTVLVAGVLIGGLVRVGSGGADPAAVVPDRDVVPLDAPPTPSAEVVGRPIAAELAPSPDSAPQTPCRPPTDARRFRVVGAHRYRPGTAAPAIGARAGRERRCGRD
jgi:hypothetical protein